MAITVQDSRQRTVQNRPVSGQKQQIDTPLDAFGGATAQATKNLGTALQRISTDLGNQADDIYARANKARALDLQNMMQKELNDFLYNPKEGLLKKKGRDAINAKAEMQAKLGELRTKYMEIPNEAQDVMDMLESSYSNISKSYEDIAGRHAFGETENYEKDSLQSRIELNREEAALDFLNEDKFSETLAENYQSLEAQAKLNGWSSETLSLKKRQEKSTLRAAQITSMIATDRPNNIILAKKEFEAGKLRGDFDFETALKLETSLNAAVPKAAATLEFNRLGSGSGGVVGKDNIIAYIVDKIEGGDKIAEEPGGAIAKYGINSEAYAQRHGIPHRVAADKVRNLSRDEAIAEFQRDYWDQYGIDEVPEEMQFLAMDIATNHRSDFARTLIDEMKAGNIDADTALAYRLDEYRRLVRTNPGEYGQYFDGWKGRLETVAAVTRGSRAPTAEEIQASADKLNRIHPDAGGELVKMYEEQTRRANALQKAVKDEFEDTIHEKVAIAGGDYTVLTAAERARAAELGIDYTKYTGASDPETINELDAMTSDELFSVDLTQYRGQLTFDKMNEYRTKQAELQKPENKVVQDKVDQVTRYYFSAELGQNPDNKKTKAKVAGMKRFITDQLAVRFEDKGKVTDKDINDIAATFFKNRVYDPSGPFNRKDNVYLIGVDEIPREIRGSIEQSLANEGKLITENAIKERYILHLARQGDLKRTQ